MMAWRGRMTLPLDGIVHTTWITLWQKATFAAILLVVAVVGAETCQGFFPG